MRTKVKIANYNYKEQKEYIEEKEVMILYRAKHVEDRKLYKDIRDVKFLENTDILIIENKNSCYGFSVLWLKDKVNKIYEYDGFGHSGAASVVTHLLQNIITKKS